MIKPNEGKVDRIVRLVLALVFFAIATQTQGILRIVMIVLGVAMLVTALTGFCTLYKLFGFNTCPIKK